MNIFKAKSIRKSTIHFSILCSVKKANEEQYTQQEAEAAAGKTVEVYPKIQRDENGNLI